MAENGRERKRAADRKRARSKRLEQGRKPHIESVAAKARAEGINPVTLRSRLWRARDATKTMQDEQPPIADACIESVAALEEARIESVALPAMTNSPRPAPEESCIVFVAPPEEPCIVFVAEPACIESVASPEDACIESVAAAKEPPRDIYEALAWRHALSTNQPFDREAHRRARSRVTAILDEMAAEHERRRDWWARPPQGWAGGLVTGQKRHGGKLAFLGELCDIELRRSPDGR
jgi:hypothetical protein